MSKWASMMVTGTDNGCDNFHAMVRSVIGPFSFLAVTVSDVVQVLLVKLENTKLLLAITILGPAP